MSGDDSDIEFAPLEKPASQARSSISTSTANSSPEHFPRVLRRRDHFHGPGRLKLYCENDSDDDVGAHRMTGNDSEASSSKIPDSPKKGLLMWRCGCSID